MTPPEIKNTDSYKTDDWILDMFDGWFDPCPLNDNPVIDGLQLEWVDKTYVNPPYSKPLPWVLKAIEESKKGKRVVMLLKADTSTKVFAALHKADAKIFWCHKRLKHGTGSPAAFPSMLVYLGRDNE